MGHRNGVAIRGGDGVRQADAAAAGLLAKTGQQVVNALFAFTFFYGLKGVQPLLSFNGIKIVHI